MSFTRMARYANGSGAGAPGLSLYLRVGRVDGCGIIRAYGVSCASFFLENGTA
jgi:hypothetical protein